MTKPNCASYLLLSVLSAAFQPFRPSRDARSPSLQKRIKPKRQRPLTMASRNRASVLMAKLSKATTIKFDTLW
jgi:hypothetical protein